MRTIGKVVRTAKAEGIALEEQLNSFLRNYRTSKHPSTGSSPSSSLFGRETRNRIPEITDIDKLTKERMKMYADTRRHTSEINLREGDLVLLKKSSQLLRKSDPQYEPAPLTVINIKGSMVTAKNSSKTVTRNASFFRRFFTRKQQSSPPPRSSKKTSKKVTFASDHVDEEGEADAHQDVPTAGGEERMPDIDPREAEAVPTEPPPETAFHGFEPQIRHAAAPPATLIDEVEAATPADCEQATSAKEKRRKVPPRRLEDYEVKLPGTSQRKKKPQEKSHH